MARLAVNELWALKEHYGFRVLAYVFMPDHAHFVIVPAPGYTISQTMRVIKGSIARRVNAAAERAGSVWQDSFRADLPKSLDALNAYIRYIEDNPVAGGLSPTRESYPYSSADGRCIAEYREYLATEREGAG